MKLKHIYEAQQFTREWLEKELFPLAKKMEEVVKRRGADTLKGKRMITFFYEPSTRTRASFEIAMSMLGGQVVFSTENATQFSSISKGETTPDTIRVLNNYCPDVIVIRHNEEGGVKLAAQYSRVPVINAGDGSGQHPTQALLDLYTIYKKFGKIDGLAIAMVGDLSMGRTVRSLSYLLGKFKNIKIYFVVPKNLGMRSDILAYLKRRKVEFSETQDLRSVAPKVDVVYQTRTQKERGSSLDHQNNNLGFFVMDKAIVKSMKKNAIIMHPLPRNEEITTDVDNDPRAVYLTDQIQSGLVVRMALLQMLIK